MASSRGRNLPPILREEPKDSASFGSEWALLDFPFQVGNVWVLSPGALRNRLKKTGALSREAMERIARRLDLSLPPAVGA